MLTHRVKEALEHPLEKTSMAAEHPIATAAGAVAMVIVTVGLLSFLPDLIRYVKISRM